ncbi:MAG: ABC transporter substrate-binding protein [Actinomycetota bacterium]|nr:ABC transporter substrate-binding protein [Actinomycetota bacterium]
MKRILFPAALAALVLLAACGDDKAASEASQAPSAPSKIVSLSPTGTEMLFAIGAGGQVLAVDDQSDYPAEALQKPHDLSGFEPNVEAIAALEPDLVVIGDDFTGLTPQLEALGITVWSGPAAKSFDDAYAQIEQLGAVTGHVGEAAELVLKMQTDIDAVVQAAPKAAQPLTYYHELDNTYYSVTDNTFVGQVYSLFGLQSIADFQEVSGNFPQLAAEAIISADPDFIFLADGSFGESPDTVAARPGWEALKAVTNGNVVVVDDDLSSRWGPRIVDFVSAVSAVVAKATVSG